MTADHPTPSAAPLALAAGAVGLGYLVDTSVTAVGVVFVGLVAPHVARGLVGGRHALVLPVAAGLGRCWPASPTPSAAPSSRRPRSPRA